MVNDYFEGAFQHLIERGKRLLAQIPIGLPLEFQTLEQTCRQRLTHILSQLEYLAQHPALHEPNIQTELLRRLRSLKSGLDDLEKSGIAALNRANETDKYLNRLVEAIRQEIRYPLPSPVVSALSQEYFYIYSGLGLLCVPLSEADFMLHLPDLYHELAHPLIEDKYDPRIQRFQQNLEHSLGFALNYIAQELEKEGRRRSPQSYRFYLQKWMQCWHNWLIEFFCDLFAIYTVGSAFAWANVHLCALKGGNPYYIPTIGPRTSHPADDARMRVMLLGLKQIGFTEEACNIEQRWAELVGAAKDKPQPEYHWCYPEHILRYFVEKAFDGVVDMGCRIVEPTTNDPVHQALNAAWSEFWLNPTGYSVWEKNIVSELKTICNM